MRRRELVDAEDSHPTACELIEDSATDRAAQRAGETAKLKIATFNVNSVNGGLPVLLRWLTAATPASRFRRR